ncbi:MAG: DNA translocase FtsK [Clostridiales bacterium]|nr:DNA translocase FtsK [Clostridiales bacterium]
MPKKKKNKRKIEKQLEQLEQFQFSNEVKGIFIIALGIMILISIQGFGAGKIGEGIKSILLGSFSSAALVIPYIVILSGALIFISSHYWNSRKNIVFFSLQYFCLLIFISLRDIELLEGVFALSFNKSIEAYYLLGLERVAGGVIGNSIAYILVQLIGITGTYVLLISIFIISVLIYTKISLLSIILFVKTFSLKCLLYIKNITIEYIYISKSKNSNIKRVGSKTSNVNVSMSTDSSENIETQNIQDTNSMEEIKILAFNESYTKADNKVEKLKRKNDTRANDKEGEVIQLEMDSLAQEKKIEYIIPSIELLNKAESNSSSYDKKNIIKQAKILEETLENFGVKAKVIQVSKGPVITRYELQPYAGVKVSKIVNLSDDIALNLAAPSIRIEAPIPGKAAIGIEIPNQDTSTVGLREVIDSKNYERSTFNIPYALGKDISGNAVIADISRMPHMLVAGATGSGKSICINVIILSILFKADPDDVKLILIDPKVVELNQYNGMPHLLIPVITDPKKATGALNWAVQEMTRRYNLFAESGTKDINSYNSKNIEEKLPFIVIIIDELADLMMASANEVEDSICRLAQMARASGIHMIIATQRPSVDVITGIIKANIPSRIAFSVTSVTDSRTILDMGGAEKLLGKGDMLFYPAGASKPVRIQGAYVSEEEIESVLTFIKDQENSPVYESEIINKIEEKNSFNKDVTDDMFYVALDLVVNHQQASVSMLQRKLRIGYNRAARIIDDLEEKGIVGPHEGSKPRRVLLTKEEKSKIKNEEVVTN